MVPEECDRLGRSFGLAVNPKVVEPQETAQENPGLLVAGGHDGRPLLAVRRALHPGIPP